jgi:hypothetical protein
MNLKPRIKKKILSQFSREFVCSNVCCCFLSTVNSVEKLAAVLKLAIFLLTWNKNRDPGQSKHIKTIL